MKIFLFVCGLVCSVQLLGGLVLALAFAYFYLREGPTPSLGRRE